MERYFEKISFAQFKKDIKDDKELYYAYVLPQRKTKYSAGHDFFALEDIEILPGEVKKIPTGYKAKFLEDEVLLIIVRSSMGFKYNIRLTNQVGVIDSDYYNNIENEGHIYVSLQNEGKEKIVIKKGTGYVQGLFIKYLTSEDPVANIRTGWSANPNKDEKEGDKNE